MAHTDDLFSSIWRRQQEAAEEPPPDVRCTYAQRFAAWAEELCRDFLPKRDLVALNQAKLLLVDKYFEWRVYVPKSHRYRMGDNGHTCIFHIFEACYQQIKLTELALSPPKLPELQAPPPAAVLRTEPPPEPPAFLSDTFLKPKK